MGIDCFEAAVGPFRRYQRSLAVGTDGRVTEVVEHELAVPFWWVVFALPMRSALRRPGRARPPWWASPQVLDARAATVLGLLASLALVEGYVATLLTQTITYAADSFGASRADQGITLAVARAGVLLTAALAARADARGRQRIVLVSAAAASVAAAGGALAPGLYVLGATQLVATGCAGAVAVLLVVICAEEMPAGARAYGLALLTMAGALGAGMCVWALPLADTGRSGWRAVYVIPLLGVGVVAAVARRLPETERFERRAPATLGGHGARLGLLAAIGFFGALFVAPAFQFQNDFLRQEHGWSAARISAFTLLTGTPGAIGIVVGGHLAEVRGRRLVGAAGVAGGTVATVAFFWSSGWALWAWAVAGSIVGAMVVPALGIYSPELFPTALRGRLGGVVQVVTLAGSAVGLLAVGASSDRWGYGWPITLAAAGPLVVVALVLARLPETAHRELEELNPEDQRTPAGP